MSYGLSILPRATRELAALAEDVRDRLVTRIATLATDPRPRGCRKLVGRDGYRLRVGRYRVVYSVDDASRDVVVLHVGHRRDVYR